MANATILQNSTVTTYGSNMTYECNDNHRFIHGIPSLRTTITCSAEGLWPNITDNCRGAKMFESNIESWIGQLFNMILTCQQDNKNVGGGNVPFVITPYGLDFSSFRNPLQCHTHWEYDYISTKLFPVSGLSC